MSNGSTLSEIERKVIASILLGVLLIVGVDLYTDLIGGGSILHLSVEFCAALIAAFGFFILIRNSFKVIHLDLQQMKNDATKWKNESVKYIEGLSYAIDSQLDRWNLSPSEKEVALLLLKGLSLKEIAELRSTSEKTARAQSASVYQKSGLAGRSELSAFFLEDLLTPGLLRPILKNDQRQ
ncbi:MAG: helix-turn-helix transcriptional regulator [Pseudobdellovibrionaceae bacterium]